MKEYIEKWESYVAEHYKPEEMTRCQLEELYKIADIMKDMVEYWRIKKEYF
jgi:hypothetical protein